MLKTLSIKNYALIEELTVEFSNGLVIITGETGSGKSIIIDALGLILGARSSADVVRKGSDRAVVEGTFHIAGNKKLQQILGDNGISAADELIVRREVSSKGQSRCFIADSPATLALQKQVGDLLVDLHGQHEHQSLLRLDTHIAMLDDFGGTAARGEEGILRIPDRGDRRGRAAGRGGRRTREGAEDPGERRKAFRDHRQPLRHAL